jgi:hypothetical protein
VRVVAVVRVRTGVAALGVVVVAVMVVSVVLVALMTGAVSAVRMMIVMRQALPLRVGPS